MSTRIDRETFLDTYRPMQKAGKTADEIGAKLGITGKQVSAKATVYRTAFKTYAIKAADEQELTGDKRKAFLASVNEMVPTLTSRTRKANKLGDYITKLLAEADAKDESEAPE